MNNETDLLMAALLFEEGDPRGTQHLLSVLALTGLHCRCAGRSLEDEQQLAAAAVLRDLTELLSGEEGGEAGPESLRPQTQELARYFLRQARYAPSYEEEILRLALARPRCGETADPRLGLLMEARILASCLESGQSPPDAARSMRSRCGKRLMKSIINTKESAR
ncbi:MAG: hypothetical protein Q4B42_03215 [Oscillospiraceae bacterium]|nr:hypothetical protein [Oscillospiraceae bacterium]